MAKKFVNKENLKLAIDTLNKNIQEELDHKADIDGSYPDLSVGTAGNLLGSKEIVNSSAYRTSANDEDIEYGTAEIQSIKGNAIAWNQLVKNGNFADGVTGFYFHQLADYSLSNNVITIYSKESTTDQINISTNVNLIANHKYLFVAEVKSENDTTSAGLFINSVYKAFGKKTSFTRISNLISFEEGYSGRLQIRAQGTVGNEFRLSIKNFQLFDLTLIYGAGNEPTTAEQFEADYQRWFGKPLEYEEYDEGSIRSVKATGIKTVGFNLYDGGDFEGTISEWYNNGNNILWKNNCGYKGKIQVQADFTNSDVVGTIYIVYTDGTYSAVGYGIGTNTKAHDNAISSDGKIVDYIRASYRIALNSKIIKISNICINFSWSGKRDGEYEPHWEETKPIPIIDLMGKLNGERESVTIFHDGLKRAGNVYDEIYVENGVTKAIKRIEELHIGDNGLEATTYETPEVYILNNFELPINYRVDDFGTEQILMPEDSIAPIITTKYGINAVDAIRRMSERFIKNPHNGEVGQVLTKTNDSAEWQNVKGEEWDDIIVTGYGIGYKFVEQPNKNIYSLKNPRLIIKDEDGVKARLPLYKYDSQQDNNGQVWQCLSFKYVNIIEFDKLIVIKQNYNLDWKIESYNIGKSNVNFYDEDTSDINISTYRYEGEKQRIFIKTIKSDGLLSLNTVPGEVRVIYKNVSSNEITITIPITNKTFSNVNSLTISANSFREINIITTPENEHYIRVFN